MRASRIPLDAESGLCDYPREMKIKRRKKIDRTAFFFMHRREYTEFRRFVIKGERRRSIDRDRSIAASLRKRFVEGPGVSLAAIFAKT